MFKVLAFVLLLVALGVAEPSIGYPELSLSCGSNPSPSNILQTSAEVSAAELAESSISRRTPRTRKPIKVDTYFHVLAENKTLEGGWLPKSILKTQLDILKKGFQPANIQFNLKKTTYTLNHDWSFYDSVTGLLGPDLPTKKKLRKGDYKTLNIYFMHKFGIDGVGGWATFPNKTEKGSDQFWTDGAQVLTSTLPGLYVPSTNPTQPNNASAGTILVHEVGHWFGLLHTFGVEFSCEGPGDYVSDTPQERFPLPCGVPADFPIEILDTCPELPGINNWGNFMTYTEDWCMDFFTGGQIQRMRSWWKLYRSGNDGDYWYFPTNTTVIPAPTGTAPTGTGPTGTGV